jgi:prepilin-type N-terminal cleavage/methylation domain-containing protein
MRTPSRSRFSSDQGFTLVELMVAALIMTFVLGGTVMLATQMQRVYGTQLDDAGLEQEARYALDWIARDIRSAGSDAYFEMDEEGKLLIDPNGGGDPNDSLGLTADINPSDGDVDDDGEDITIALNTGTGIITRTDTNAGVTESMTDGVFTDLEFTFLDWTRTATNDDTAVAYVQVEVTAQSRAWNTQLGARNTVTLSTEVRLRTR